MAGSVSAGQLPTFVRHHIVSLTAFRRGAARGIPLPQSEWSTWRHSVAASATAGGSVDEGAADADVAATSCGSGAHFRQAKKSSLQSGQQHQQQRAYGIQQAGQGRNRGGTSKRIQLQIFKAKNAGRIADLVAVQGNAFTAVNVVSALTELARLADGGSSRTKYGAAASWRSSSKLAQQQALVQELAALAAPHVPEFNPYQVSTCVWALAKLKYAPPALLSALVSRAEVQLHAFDPVQLPQLLWGLSTLRHAPSKEFMAAATAAALPRLSEYHPHGLANLAWACARLRSKQPKLLNKVAEQAAANIDAFTTQGLSNLAWAYAVLHHYPGPLLPALAATAHAKLADFSCQGIANTVWACSQFDYAPQGVLDALTAQPDAYLLRCNATDACNLLVAAGRLRVRDPGFLRFLLAVALRQPQRLKAVEVAGMMWAVGKLQFLPIDMLQPLNAAVAAVVPQLRGQALANVLWAMGRLREAGWDSGVQAQLLEQAQDAQPFAAQHLANIAWAAVRLHARGEADGALHSVVDRACGCAGEFSAGELSVLVWAAAKGSLNAADLQPLLSAATASFEHTPASFNAQDMSMLAWGLAKLGVPLPPPAALSAWLSRPPPDLAPRHLASLAWALARLAPTVPPPGSEEAALAAPPADPALMTLLVAASAPRVEAFGAQDLANWVHSLGKLQFRPEEWLLDALAQQAERKLPLLNEDELVNTLWGFASLGHHPGALLGMAANRVEAGGRARYAQWHLDTLSWCYQRLGHSESDSVGHGIAAVVEGKEPAAVTRAAGGRGQGPSSWWVQRRPV